MANSFIKDYYKLGVRLWERMYRIRTIEESIAERYPEGKMRCPTHLSVGQEGVPSALAESIGTSDYAVSTHRGHAHYLAKGGSLVAMLGELYGKKIGCCGGRGGSMHLVDTSVGFMGTTAIVGNSIPLGVGLALSAQLRGTKQISCIYLGDGATEEGSFYESVNFAIVRGLPVLFLCENNLYSVYSPLSVRQPEGRKIHEMVAAMGIKTGFGDGNDALVTAATIADAVAAIRQTGRPYFLEFSTYRWREHCGPDYDNHLDYRTEEEFEYWKSRDPIRLLENYLNSQNNDFFAISKKYKELVALEISEAFQIAEDAPFAETEFAYQGVYAE